MKTTSVSTKMSKRQYNALLESKLKQFKCTSCADVILKARDFRNHMQSEHGLSAKTCPWCTEYSFVKMDYEHLIKCCKEHVYIAPASVPEKIKPKQEITNYAYNSEKIDTFFANQKMIREVQYFGDVKVDSWYADINDLAPEWLRDDTGVLTKDLDGFHNKIKFDYRSNLDAKWPLAFIYKRNLVWKHISIRYGAWSSFLASYNDYKGQECLLLPWWCLCKGGNIDHRHMMIVFRDKMKFKSFWSRVVEQEKDHIERHQCKFEKPIQTLTHFAETITYLSNSKSQCSFSSLKTDKVNEYYDTDVYQGFKRNVNKGRGMCHYWIGLPTIPYVPLWCALLKRGGLSELLVHKCKNALPYKSSTSLQKRAHDGSKKFSVEYKDLPIEQDIIAIIGKMCELVPFGEEIIVTKGEFIHKGDDSDRGFIYINDEIYNLKINRKLERMNNQQWNTHQIDKKNHFIGAVGESLFVLGKKAQEILHHQEEMVKELRRLNISNEKKDEEIRKKDQLIFEKDCENKRLYNLLIEMKK